MKKLNFVLKKFYDKYFINLDFFDYFEKSFFILFIICICSLEFEFQTIPLKIILVSITFWGMVWHKDNYYKNSNFANPKEELATMLRENLKHDIPLIFVSTLLISFPVFLSTNDYKPIGIFLGLLDYEKLDSELYKFSFNDTYFSIVLVFSLFFVFVILYLLSFLYLDMKYLMPERGGLSKKEYNLRCRTLEDIIKTCTNEKKLEEFMNSFDLESRESFSTKFKENKHKHKRESMLLLLYQPALKKFLTKYRDKPKFEKAVINLHNEAAKRFSIEKEIGFEY